MALVDDIARLAIDRPRFQQIVNGDANATVTTDGGVVPSLARLLAQMGAGSVKGAWVTATAYVLGDVVTSSGTAYRCVTAHTSAAAFATDLAATKWIVHYTATSTIDTIALLRTAANTYGTVMVLGYYAANDIAGARLYWWDSASVTADNGGTVIGSATVGRWKLLATSHEISVLDFGAKGDGTTDDTTAVQAAITAAGDGRVVFFPQPSVRYKITATLLLSLTSKLRGEGGLLLSETIGFYGTGPAIKGADANANYKGEIVGLCITNYSGGTATHGIHIYNAAAMWIHKNVIQGFTIGDGVRIEVSATWLKGAYFNRLHQNYYYSCKRGVALIGSALSGVNGNQIIGGEIADTSGLMTHGIYIDGTGGCSGCTVEDIDIEPPGALGSSMVAGIECVGLVQQCIFKGVRMELAGAVPHYVFSTTSIDNLILGGSYQTNNNVGTHFSDSNSVYIIDNGWNNQIFRYRFGNNYVENGGFERWNGSPLIPAGTGFADGSTGVRAADYDFYQESGAGNFKNGSYSLRQRNLTATGPSRLYWTAPAELIQRFKGQRMMLRFWMKSSNPTNYLATLNDGVSTWVPRAWPAANTWGIVEVHGFFSAAATTCQIILQQNASGADFSTYVDDLQLFIVNDQYNESPPDMLRSIQRVNGQWWMLGTAAPTGGTWARGDRVIQLNPSVGVARGWTCTVAGTPGTWVSEGNL